MIDTNFSIDLTNLNDMKHFIRWVYRNVYEDNMTARFSPESWLLEQGKHKNEKRVQIIKTQSRIIKMEGEIALSKLADGIFNDQLNEISNQLGQSRDDTLAILSKNYINYFRIYVSD